MEQTTTQTLSRVKCYSVRKAAMPGEWPFRDRTIVKGFWTGRVVSLPADGGGMVELNLGDEFGFYLFRRFILQESR